MRWRTDIKPGRTLCCMLHSGLLGDAGSRTDPVAQVGPLTPTPSHHRARKASVSDAAFSLEVSQGQKRKTIAFLTDGNSKGEGELQIGSQATVEYRSRDGTNAARQVVVTPPVAWKRGRA